MKARWMGIVSATLIGAGVTTALLTGAGRVPSPAPAAPAAEAVKYTLDAVHSSNVFKIRHMGLAPFYGRFDKMSGEFTWDPSKPEAASITVIIDAASVNSNHEGRDKHLRNPDFFNASEHKEIKFVSTGLAKSGDGWELSGDLTLLGKTKPIKAKFDFGGVKEGPRGTAAGFEASFTFKRSDFGMNYGVENGALSDDVTVMLGIEGKPG